VVLATDSEDDKLGVVKPMVTSVGDLDALEDRTVGTVTVALAPVVGVGGTLFVVIVIPLPPANVPTEPVKVRSKLSEPVLSA
jgi:hypothetical protein